MRLSTKGEYGLLAIVDLALYCGTEPVQVNQIATRQGISKQYLDQLMLLLKKAGLVASSRGRQGGYQLSRPANTITLFEVVNVLEGPLTNSNFHEKRRKKLGVRSVLKNVWDELFTQEIATLQSKTVQDICEEHLKSSDVILYDI